MKKIAILFIFLSLRGVSQNWKTFFSYRNVIDIVPAKHKIYCATSNAIFSYNINSREIKKITKTNGLSDIGISTICYDENRETLYVGYYSGLLDVITITGSTAYKDIAQSAITHKRIYKILPYNDKVYLCTEFGIIEYLPNTGTFGNTFFIGDTATQIPIYDMLINNKKIYITTSQGIKRIDITQKNLNYNNWNTLPKLESKIPKQIQSIGNDIFAYNDKGIYKYNGLNWILLKKIEGIRHLKIYNDKILITFIDKIKLYDHSFNFLDKIEYSKVYFNKAISHQSNIYIATQNYGVLYREKDKVNFIKPNALIYNIVKSVLAKNGTLWLLPTIQNAINQICLFQRGSWKYYSLSDMMGVENIHHITIYPNQVKDAYFSSSSRGIVKFKDGKAIKKYYKDVFEFSKQNASRIDIGKGIFDRDENYWTLNNFVDHELVLKTNDDKWYRFNINSGSIKQRLSDIVIDKDNNKWIATQGNGIVVYHHSNSIESNRDDNIAYLSTHNSKGGLPSNIVNTLAVDKDGKVWIGTIKGLVVFTSHSLNNVFGSEYKAKHITVDNGDGMGHNLLSNQKVVKILVDGANRKWIATAHYGVYYLSSDGKKMLYHFHKGNSPLPSNEISDISIDGSTGEIYFCTKAGMVSYQNRITNANKEFKKVYVYPNPVLPNYKGAIYIKGLAENSDVKITDVLGNLVYQTISEGGQVAWDGNTQDYQRVSSGVYLVFATSENGNTAMTKIVIIN